MMTIEILRQALQAVGPTAAVRARLRSRIHRSPLPNRALGTVSLGCGA